jgi:hypothetical protein
MGASRPYANRTPGGSPEQEQAQPAEAAAAVVGSSIAPQLSFWACKTTFLEQSMNQGLASIHA